MKFVWWKVIFMMLMQGRTMVLVIGFSVIILLRYLEMDDKLLFGLTYG